MLTQVIQYLATVCLCSPRFLPTCVKSGFTPSCRHMLGSPITFLSNRAPSNGCPVGSKHIAGSPFGERTVAPLPKLQ